MADQDSTTSPEVFKPIPDFPGYAVSNMGQVRSYWRRVGKDKGLGTHGVLDTEVQRTLTPAFTRGYPSVTLAREGKHYTRRVHRLVLEAFVGPCPTGEGCRHLDGNPGNPFLTNLAWGTYKENEADKKAHGNTMTGEKHHKAKLTDPLVIHIRELFKQGVPQNKLAQMANVSPPVIWKIVHHLAWRHLKAEKPNQMP